MYLFKVNEFKTTYIKMDTFQHNIEFKKQVIEGYIQYIYHLYKVIMCKTVLCVI